MVKELENLIRELAYFPQHFVVKEALSYCRSFWEEEGKLLLSEEELTKAYFAQEIARYILRLMKKIEYTGMEEYDLKDAHEDIGGVKIYETPLCRVAVTATGVWIADRGSTFFEKVGGTRDERN